MSDPNDANDTLRDAPNEALGDSGFQRGGLLAVSFAAGVGVGLATDSGTFGFSCADPIGVMRSVEETWRPRWVWWSIDTPLALTAAGLRVATCWDLAAVHRLLFGGWKADIARVWSRLHGLAAESIPTGGQLDLVGGDAGSGDDHEPVRADGHLRPEWVQGAWAESAPRMARWAETALAAQSLQSDLLTKLGAQGVLGQPLSTARSESAAELLCAELATDGLPVDLERAEALIGALAGPRPRTEREAIAIRTERDAQVFHHVSGSDDIDLRNPAQVKALLRRVGIEVPDTRASRLKEMRSAHPVIEALLQWRKAERVATTFGYPWLDAHVGTDGRLRGAWSGSDGAAGRMTAQAGLHNMPVDMRDLVAADDGWVFVRADLGQIEPRVLATVSGDAALARATLDDDLYAPVAKRLGVERSVAKVAVLAAMYGQTSGVAGQALRGLETAYPVAMKYLGDADKSGQAGVDLRTYGGRLIRMWPDSPGADDRSLRSSAAARGRYARNAMVQGAAAELFKVWAVIVRSRVGEFGGQIVLCLHDELLVHVPVLAGEAVKDLLNECLQHAAHVWAPGIPVRFVADASVIQRWSDAKG